MTGQSSSRSRSSSRRDRKKATMLLGPAQFGALTSVVCALLRAGVAVPAIFDADVCISYLLTPHQHHSGLWLLRISFVDLVDSNDDRPIRGVVATKSLCCLLCLLCLLCLPCLLFCFTYVVQLVSTATVVDKNNISTDYTHLYPYLPVIQPSSQP